jgi:hypothetical protein
LSKIHIISNGYPEKKTYIIDSEWIAELALNDLIFPLRISSKDMRDIQALTGLREKMVKEQTDRVHTVLDSVCIRLSVYFMDLFGKSGLRLLKCILFGGSPERARNWNRQSSTICKKTEENYRYSSQFLESV